MVPKYLPVIDSRCASWQAQVDRQMDLGSNFLFIFPQNFADALVRALGTMDSEALQALDIIDLLPLAHCLHPGALPILKSALADNAVVYFVKQLNFPPRSNWNPSGYLLYCSVRGILACFENLPDAREACLREHHELLMQGEFPEVGIYQWGEPTGSGRWLQVYAPWGEPWATTEPKPVQLTLDAVA